MSVSIGRNYLELKGSNWEFEITPSSIYFEHPLLSVIGGKDEKELVVTQRPTEGTVIETQVSWVHGWLGVWRGPNES